MRKLQVMSTNVSDFQFESLCQTTNWIILLYAFQFKTWLLAQPCQMPRVNKHSWILIQFRQIYKLTAENHAIRALWGSVRTAASAALRQVVRIKMLDTLNVTCSYFMVLILVRGLLNTFQTGSSLKAKWTATAFFGRTGTILTIYSTQHLK